MPNIIVNNYCNQACSYCFANANMNDANLQKNMKLSTYILILKYLKMIGDTNVRILGGEPIIFPKLREFIDIAIKGGFHIIVFSNINMKPEKFKKIFTGVRNLRINCNINDETFYTQEEKENIYANLEFLQSQNIPTILGYNITSIDLYPHFHIALAERYNIKHLNLKITNTSLGDTLLIDTGSRLFGKYIFKAIEDNYKKFNIELSCGLSPKVFTQQEIDFIKEIAKIKIFYGCDGHSGRFDINTDGSIFKCYPLESLYIQNKTYIQSLIQKKIPLQQTLNTLYQGVYSEGECTAHSYIKKK